jgi:hypothetical protein
MSTSNDEEMIRRSLCKHSFHVDRGEFEKFVSFYTEDSVVEAVGEVEAVIKGRDGLLAWLNDNSASGKRISWRHYNTNHVVTVRGDRAQAMSYNLAFEKLPGLEAKFRAIGYYEDYLVKRGGEWLIEKRRILFDASDLGEFWD